jgi:hypothetical protein
MFMFLCHVNTGIIYEQSKMSSRYCKAAIFLDAEISHSTKTLNFLSMRKEATGLMRLVKNSDFLCSRPKCHDVSRAFSICENAATVDILLSKLRVT